jgi:hypothetical protein
LNWVASIASSISRISLKRHGGECVRHLNIVVMPQRP